MTSDQVSINSEFSKDLIPLSELREGDLFIIREFRGCNRFAYRLISMGLYAGVPLIVFKKSFSGRMIIKAGVNSIGLGCGEINKIWVEKI